MENAEIGLTYELSPSERKEVRDRYPEVSFPDPTLEPVWFGRRDHRRIPEKRAIVDQAFEGNYPMVFGICSDQYKLVHYEDIVAMVEHTASNITGFGEIKVCPHTYADGGRMKITLKFPDMKSEIKKMDVIVPKIDVFTSYDLSTKLTGKFGAFQLKCTNGMGVWKTFKKFAKRHLQNLRLNELEENINQGLAIFGDQINTWKSWTEKRITKDFYEEIWEALPFSDAERSKIETLPEIGSERKLLEVLPANTLDLWMLNSVLTQFATHEVKSELRRIELETSIAKAMESISIKI